MAEYEGKITGVEEKYKTEELIKTKSVMVSWSKNLDELKLRIPKDVWLNELTVAEGKLITFNGTAVFADSIIEFIKSLNTSVCFKDFSLQNTAIVKTKDKWLIKFVLTGYSRN